MGFCLLSFLLFLLISSDCLAQRKTKVLVLHSYHQGLVWTDNITNGIQSAFLPHQSQFEINYEYLDTKRNIGRDYMEQMLRLLSKKNEHIEYGVIIVSDNTALKLINQGRITFKGNPPVVFCGINNFKETLISGIDQVTGVVERTDHLANIELMLKLHPQRKRILVIIDRTATGNAVREEFRDIELHYGEMIEFTFLRDFLLEEIPGLLEHIEDETLIYVTTFNRDRDGNFISYSEGMEMIAQNSNKPIYAPWGFYLGKGIVGGKITSGDLQGELAGALALEILQGREAGELPIITNSPTRYIFDYNYLKRNNISESLLPKGSQLINRPPDAYERYKSLLIGITIISLSAFLIVTWKFRRQKTLLAVKNALAQELERKVFERTRELERINEKLQQLSNQDGLTGIYNRRYFDNTLNREINRLQRTATPLSLILCDIDEFKKYNDTYGHLAGDDCLRTIATIFQQHCKRISDVAARYGGEEFAIILPNTTPEDAWNFAESLRLAIEQKQIPHEYSLVSKVVTVSFGIATLTPNLHTTPAAVLKLTDKALYESKHGGRNRVTLKAV